MVQLKETILHGPRHTLPIHQGSIPEVLVDAMKKKPKEAIVQVDGETGESLTAWELYSYTVQVAEGLKEYGMESADVAVFIGQNSTNIFIAALATMWRNGVVAPIDPSMKVGELQHMFNLCEPKFAFCEEHLAESVSQALKRLNNDAKIIILDAKKESRTPHIKFEDLYREADIENFTPEPVANPRSQLAFIVSSSGSTGLPKGVGLTHYNVLYQLATLDQLPKPITERVFMQLTQFFWISGVFCLILLTLTGSKRVFIKKFHEETLFKAIEKYKTEWMMMSPAELGSLLRHPDFHKYDLSSMALIATGGAPLTKALSDKVKEQWGQDVRTSQAYGMTEIAGIITAPSLTNTIVESVGTITAGLDLKVVSLEDGRSLGPREQGEFCFRTGALMKGYVNNDEATNEVIDEQGWFHSGDVGYYDEEGRLFIVDRIKEFIKYRTWQVPPLELECLIETIPGVKDVGVTGIPHKADIYHPMALVIRKEGSKVTEQEIVEFVANQLSEHKQLRGGVVFVDFLPRTPTGKLRRRNLKEQALRILAEQ